jgi:serine protease
MLVGAVLAVTTTGPAAVAGVPARHAAPASPGRPAWRHITLKLDDGTGATPDLFGDLHGPARLAALNAVLTGAGAHGAARLFDGPDPAVLRAAHEATRTSARPVPDLSQYFRIQVPAGIDPAVLSAQLAVLPGVQDAYPAPLPAPAPGSAPAPAVPSFTALQHYADAAPVGVGARQTANWPGATGTQVKIVDVEYSWNTAHNDLPKARAPGAELAFHTPVDPYTDNNHGTAVLGVLAAAPNSYGVSGLAAGAALGLVNVDSVQKGYDPAGAILLAASKMRPGDVLLLEQQAYGPNNGGYVPLEWIPEVYDAIRYTVHAGINVVEAAGNGGQNLNDPSFGSPFPRGKADSGAVLVGAGASPGFPAAAGSYPCVLSYFDLKKL